VSWGPPAVLAAGQGGGALRLGLVVAAFGFGLRHGIDWDHIAAITDLAGSQPSRKRSMGLATCYVIGHGAVILVLGVAAIVFSERLPGAIDGVIEKIVGATLVALGAYLVVALVRDGRDARLRSRWMLVIAGVRRLVRWARRRPATQRVVIEHEHEHDHDRDHGHEGVVPHEHVHQHSRVAVAVGQVAAVQVSHRHRHRHVVTMPDDPFLEYSVGTATGVGMIHGIGAETPTQVLVFVAAAGAAGIGAGLLVLACFVAGLLMSNTAIALAATFGYSRASRNLPVYVAISSLTAVFSIVVGLLFLLGHGNVLPGFFAG
jgi:ABC-type nickel/cobalt efflux system permease component RcnA